MNSTKAWIKPSNVDTKKAQKIIFEPNPGPQTDFLSASEQEALFGGAAGGGKVVLKGQSVLTPSGFVESEDLREGMTICDPNGGTQTITHLHPWQKGTKWEVEFDDGTVYPTLGGHLWRYWLSRNGPSRYTVRTTEEMLQHSIKTKRTPIIPTNDVVDFESQDITIEPYLLGCLLGDGCLTTKRVSFITHQEDWPHFKSEFNLPEIDYNYTSENGCSFKGETRKEIVGQLEAYGLLYSKSNNKFVPQGYLWNSSDVRLAILQGLMDTDGYRDKGRARAEFTSVSKQLVEGVKFLAQSLGFRVSTYTKIGSYKDSEGNKVLCQEVFRLYITGYDVDSIFRLQRKKIGILGKQVGRRVVDIRKTTEEVEGRCITVSSEHSLYVSDDFVVTHNSFAMVADPIRYVNNPAANMLLVRRSTEELRELISVSKKLYTQAIPEARFLERDKTWVFPSGATLWMSYLDRDDDVTRYQGQAFNWIGFDELTQWNTPYAWNYMRSRLRTAKGTGLKLYQRATTNPGNVGHHWVKKAFIDPAPPNTSFWATNPETGETIVWPSTSNFAKENDLVGKPMLKRRFIPATLFDNPYLAEDGMYEANLLSLPEHQRRQLLEGDWNMSEGAAFPEFSLNTHVIEPFDIPSSWTRFRAADYGYGSHTGVLWFAVSPSEQLIVYRELFVSRVTAVDLADMINDIENAAGERLRYGVLDSSLWHNRGDTGPSLAEQMILRGCRWRPSDRSKGSRVAGKNEIHRRLQVDEFTKEPRMVFFNTCRNVISQIPSLPLDKNNPEDVDTNSEDHLYDALRYGVMTRPRSSLFDYDPARSRSGFQIADKKFGY